MGVFRIYFEYESYHFGPILRPLIFGNSQILYLEPKVCKTAASWAVVQKFLAIVVHTFGVEVCTMCMVAEYPAQTTAPRMVEIQEGTRTMI